LKLVCYHTDHSNARARKEGVEFIVTRRAFRAASYVLVLGALGLLWLPCASAQAEDSSTIKVGGLLFGDLYHVASHHTDAGDGATGAVLRRGYLTFDADSGKDWYGRLRFELNQAGAFETYTFEADVKDQTSMRPGDSGSTSCSWVFRRPRPST